MENVHELGGSKKKMHPFKGNQRHPTEREELSSDHTTASIK